MIKMIIDCDPGHDDAIAIILAHAIADVVGVTTVSGNAPLNHTTANALAVHALIEVTTPVHSGASRPLVAKPVHAAAVHGETGLDGVTLPSHNLTITSDQAVEYLLDSAEADTWVVAVGPLTNLALALEQNPDWGKQIAGISIMGGSTSFGNATATAEFNIFHDPEAAARVFQCGTSRIVMCGLNLTHQFCTNDHIVENLNEVVDAGGEFAAIARFASQNFEHLHNRIERLRGERRAALHDPCAVLAITHPDLFEFERRRVDVELDGRYTRGMTVVDERPRTSDNANVEVAYSIDSFQAFRTLLAPLGVMS